MGCVLKHSNITLIFKCWETLNLECNSASAILISNRKHYFRLQTLTHPFSSANKESGVLNSNQVFPVILTTNEQWDWNSGHLLSVPGKTLSLSSEEISITQETKSLPLPFHAPDKIPMN